MSCKIIFGSCAWGGHTAYSDVCAWGGHTQPRAIRGRRPRTHPQTHPVDALHQPGACARDSAASAASGACPVRAQRGWWTHDLRSAERRVIGLRMGCGIPASGTWGPSEVADLAPPRKALPPSSSRRAPPPQQSSAPEAPATQEREADCQGHDQRPPPQPTAPPVRNLHDGIPGIPQQAGRATAEGMPLRSLRIQRALPQPVCAIRGQSPGGSRDACSPASEKRLAT